MATAPTWRASSQAPWPQRRAGEESCCDPPADENGEVTLSKLPVETITGMAPQCKLVSLKVLDDNGQGEVSSLIAAIDEIQRINGYRPPAADPRREPERRICVRTGVVRLRTEPAVRRGEPVGPSGVVVVTAAGNTGYGYNQTAFRGPPAAGLGMSINDPGNAELAITVGSNPPGNAPRLRSFLLFLQRAHRGRPNEARPRGPRGEDSSPRSCPAGSGGVACLYAEDSGTSIAPRTSPVSSPLSCPCGANSSASRRRSRTSFWARPLT